MPKKYNKAISDIFNSMTGMNKPKVRSLRPTKSAPDPYASRMQKGPSDKVMNKPIDKVMNKPDGMKQIGDMIKNAARNPADYYSKNAPIKKGRTSGPAERVGRKYGTKAGRAIDRGINAVSSSTRNVANRIKGRAMDIHGEAQQKKFSGYDMVKAGAAGAAGFGIGQAVGSKWSEHKRQQRGY